MSDATHPGSVPKLKASPTAMPGNVITFGQMMQNAFNGSALLLGYWWWFIPPGLAITLIVGGAYFMNVGLDEVFNPRLREM